MITLTLDLALERFGFLRNKVDEVVSVDTLELLRSLWTSYRGRQNPYVRRLSVTGIDSGYNYIEYRGYALYVVNTIAVLVSEDREESSEGWVDVDIVTSPNIEYELSLLAMCMEIESIKKMVSKADLVLVDGSLIAMFSKLYKASMDLGLEVLENKGINVEKILKDLVYTVSIYPKKFVFISKNSNSKDLLGLVKGDIYYIERYTDFEPGYTKPVDLASSRHLGVATAVRLFRHYVKKLTGLDLSVGLTYIRFDSFKRVYRVELALEREEDIDGRVRYIINTLSDINISGYPYPLMRAHDLAKISGRDVERIAILLGIAKDPRDRGYVLT